MDCGSFLVVVDHLGYLSDAQDKRLHKLYCVVLSSDNVAGERTTDAEGNGKRV